MTRYLLDTNMVSYIVKRRSPAARARLFALDQSESACISVVTEAELRYGLAKRPEANALRALMRRFLAGIEVLPWTRHEAEIYGDVRATLEKRGKTLAALDLMIAAHAVATGAILVTSDKAFSHVEELHATEDWATDL